MWLLLQHEVGLEARFHPADAGLQSAPTAEEVLSFCVAPQNTTLDRCTYRDKSTGIIIPVAFRLSPPQLPEALRVGKVFVFPVPLWFVAQTTYLPRSLGCPYASLEDGGSSLKGSVSRGTRWELKT